MKEKPNLRGDSHLAALQYLVFGSLVLYFGRELFVPLAFALLISFVLHPVCTWMESKGVGRATAIFISISLLMIIFLGLIALLAKQLIDFVQEWPSLQTKLMRSFEDLSDVLVNSFGISQDQQNRWWTQLGDDSLSGALTLLQQTISVSALSFVMLILIPVYSALILYYRHMWVRVLYRIFPNEKKGDILEILSLTIHAYYNFIKGMGVVYLAVGILNSIGLLLLGVPHAILFGFIASILTFIPYIGIMVGSLLPIAMAWITYDSIWYPLGIIGIFTFVQYLEANVIFPFAVSNRLHVNTLVVLIAIFAGGLFWGLSGMILFVPLTGILKLIADHNPRLKTLGIVLGTHPR